MKNTETTTTYTCDKCYTCVQDNHRPANWAEVTYQRGSFDGEHTTFHLCPECADEIQLIFNMQKSISAQADDELAEDAASIKDVPDIDGEDLFDFPKANQS